LRRRQARIRQRVEQYRCLPGGWYLAAGTATAQLAQVTSVIAPLAFAPAAA
jgi:hypothetical protein